MKLCGLDLETPQVQPEFGLQPWRAATGEATIKTVAVWSEDGRLRKTKRMPTTENFRQLLQVAADRKYLMCTWNGVFDLAWLCALGLLPEVKACNWMDGILLLKRLETWRAREYGGIGYGLKSAVAERWPEHAGYEGAVDVVKVPETEEEWKAMTSYNIMDSCFTALLCREYLTRMTASERHGALIECRGMPDTAMSYINGVHINYAALEPFAKDVAERRDAARALAWDASPADTKAQLAIDALSGDPKADGSVFGKDDCIMKSPIKLRKLLYEDWGCDVEIITPKGAPSTNKEALMKLAISHPKDERFGALMALRKCNTQQSKFIDAVHKSMEYHGEPITRPMPTMSGTYSGRFTYSSSQGTGKGRCQTGVALHQWERGPAARNVLTAPPGFLLAEFDFSGQEMRLMAMESEDEVMTRLFLDGGDGHAYMGASIEGLEYDYVRFEADTDPVAKAARNMGKFANLSLQYRIGVNSIMSRALTQYGLQLWQARAQHIKDTYLKTYRRVPEYWKKAIRMAEEAGYAETRGHRRIILDNLSKYEQQQTAINVPIQGTGGDMKALALATASPYFNEDCIYGWDLHDALFVYIRDDDDAMRKVLFLKKLLSNLPYKKMWGWEPEIPLPVDAKLGKTWAALKGV
jgi:hypothetical protein